MQIAESVSNCGWYSYKFSAKTGLAQVCLSNYYLKQTDRRQFCVSLCQKTFVVLRKFYLDEVDT